MTGIDALRRVKALPAKIASAQGMVRTIRYRLESITVAYDKLNVKSTPEHDRMASLVIAEERVDEMQREYDELLVAVLTAIGELVNERYADDLRLRYIEGMSPRRVARTLHYSEQGERRVHKDAREAFERIWTKTERS